MLPEALHPAQFRELAAMFVYKASLMGMQVETSFCGAGGNRLLHFHKLSPSLPNGDLYRDWDADEFAKVLPAYIGVPYPETLNYKSVLLDKNMRPMDLSLNE